MTVQIPNKALPAFVALFFCVSSLVYADDSKTELFKALRLGVEERITQSEFKCNYVYKEYIVKTKKEAESFDFTNGEMAFLANGKIAKSKDMMYEETIIQKDIYEPRQSENTIAVNNMDLAALYRPITPEGKLQLLYVNERTKEDRQTIFPKNPLAPNLDPLSYECGRATYNFFDGCEKFKSLFPDNTIITIVNGEQGNIGVKMDYDLPDQETVNKTTTFSSAFTYPVVTESLMEVKYPLRPEKYVRRIKADDFVDVENGIFMPKSIMSYEGPLSKVMGGDYQGSWRIRRWEVDNVGYEKPSESDFFIALNPNTNFGGMTLELEHELHKNQPTVFDLNRYTLYDLQHSSVLHIAPPPKNFLLRCLIMFIGCIIIIVVFAMKWLNTGSKLDR